MSRGMIDLARQAIEDLRNDGVSPTELRRLETVLREGNVGEAFIVASVLRTILDEIVTGRIAQETFAALPGIGGILPRAC